MKLDGDEGRRLRQNEFLNESLEFSIRSDESAGLAILIIFFSYFHCSEIKIKKNFCSIFTKKFAKELDDGWMSQGSFEVRLRERFMHVYIRQYFIATRLKCQNFTS